MSLFYFTGLLMSQSNFFKEGCFHPMDENSLEKDIEQWNRVGNKAFKVNIGVHVEDLDIDDEVEGFVGIQKEDFRVNKSMHMVNDDEAYLNKGGWRESSEPIPESYWDFDYNDDVESMGADDE